MARLLAALAVPALLMSLAPAAPVPKDRPEPVYYFPTTVGDTWTCRQNDIVWTVVVTSVERKGGVAVVAIERTKLDANKQKFTVTNRLHVSEHELTVVEFTGRRLKTPQCLLRPSLKPGESWTCGGPDEVLTLLPPEEVEVKAGKYVAMRTELIWDHPQSPGPTTSWYAPGVGCVYKVCHTPKGDLVTQELLSFTPAKK